MNTRNCFCGCDTEVVTAKQFAGNLLGWDLNAEFSEWMKITALLEVAAADRDRSNEENFIGDGRRIWISLRSQVHDGVSQDRQDRKLTKRWLKYSQKGRRGLEKTFSRDDMVNPFAAPPFTALEIRIWLLEGAWPDSVEELRKSLQSE